MWRSPLLCRMASGSSFLQSTCRALGSFFFFFFFLNRLSRSAATTTFRVVCVRHWRNTRGWRTPSLLLQEMRANTPNLMMCCAMLPRGFVEMLGARVDARNHPIREVKPSRNNFPQQWLFVVCAGTVGLSEVQWEECSAEGQPFLLSANGGEHCDGLSRLLLRIPQCYGNRVVSITGLISPARLTSSMPVTTWSNHSSFVLAGATIYGCKEPSYRDAVSNMSFMRMNLASCGRAKALF